MILGTFWLPLREHVIIQEVNTDWVFNKQHSQQRLYCSSDRIYNCDETGINKDESGNVTLVIKGTLKIQWVVPNDRRTTSTLACVNAIGQSMSPLIIHKSKQVKEDYFTCVQSKSVITLFTRERIYDKRSFSRLVATSFQQYCGDMKHVLLMLQLRWEN